VGEGGGEQVGMVEGKAEAGAGDGRREDQRKPGEPDVIGDRHARFVGKHGDEMRRPDSAAGGDAGERKPGHAGASVGGAGASQQIDAHEARKKTNKARKHDETQVVLSRKAGDDTEHEPQSFPLKSTAYDPAALVAVLKIPAPCAGT